MELIATFEYQDLKVETFYLGSENMKYKVSLDNDEVLSNRFRPSPIYCIDDYETTLSVVEDVVRSSGLDFHSFEVNELITMLNDYWSKDDEDFLNENNFTKTFCERITKHVTNN